MIQRVAVLGIMAAILHGRETTDDCADLAEQLLADVEGLAMPPEAEEWSEAEIEGFAKALWPETPG